MRKIVDIKTIKETPNNPRFIKDPKFKLLVQSIKKSPWMMDIRPIVVDETMTILGGNMRLKACKSAGMFDLPLDDEQPKDETDDDDKHVCELCGR